MSRAGVVYFIKPTGLPGPIKVGFSNCTPGRVRSLASWSPVLLEVIVMIPGSTTLELNIQDCLWDYHSHHEWFFPADRVMRLVADLIAGVPVEEAIDLTDRSPARNRHWRRRDPRRDAFH